MFVNPASLTCKPFLDDKEGLVVAKSSPLMNEKVASRLITTLVQSADKDTQKSRQV